MPGTEQAGRFLGLSAAVPRKSISGRGKFEGEFNMKSLRLADDLD